MALTQDTSLLSSKSSTQSLIIPGLIFAAILASIWLAFQGEDVSEFEIQADGSWEISLKSVSSGAKKVSGKCYKIAGVVLTPRYLHKT